MSCRNNYLIIISAITIQQTAKTLPSLTNQADVFNVKETFITEVTTFFN